MNRALVLAAIIPLVAGCAESAHAPVSVQTAQPPQAQEQCVDPQERLKAWQRVAEKDKARLTYLEWSGQQAMGAAHVFNSEPPPSRYPADWFALLRFVTVSDGTIYLAMLGFRGCMTAEAFINQQLADKIIARAVGQGV